MSKLFHVFLAGGPVMWPLLALSLMAVGVVVERFLAFRSLADLSPGLLQNVVVQCRQGRRDLAVKSCLERRGPLAACLAAVLQHADESPEHLQHLVEEATQQFALGMERFLAALDTTTTIAPLLGLLGTVTGMIRTFQAVAIQQQGGANDAILGGVGEALYATATGLTIAVVCFVAYNYFSARIRRVTGVTELAASTVLNVLGEARRAEGPVRLAQEAARAT
jgi:biopolymer transport protein ExbB